MALYTIFKYYPYVLTT